MIDTAQISLTVRNPCVFPGSTSILAPSDYPVYYAISKAAEVIDYSTGFSIGNSAEVVALCGTI